ncbi:hypothetical protein VNO78_19740 [Psophocarpus tetragonolobus]|uniref:Uncharacterized protein n=1 Tax=Psophocarpus tetragonolobus TaxID=3891 RepID=A0AAN9XGJ1_PSOTE
MSEESRTATFSTPSLSDVDLQLLNKRSKISYTREFLLSLDKVDSIVKFPFDAQASISCVVDDASGLLSSPLCVPDSRFKRSEPPKLSLKAPDEANQLLHKSDEPYRPPCRYKALPSSTRDSNDLLNGDTSGSSEGTNQEMENREIWRKDTVSVSKEDKWRSSKNPDSKDSPDETLMSPASSNSTTVQFISSVISKQLDASQKPSQIQGAVRSDDGLPSTILDIAKSCPSPTQLVQDLTTYGAVNLWLKTVNHTDTSWHLSMMGNCVHLMESEECPDLYEEDLEGPHAMESLKKSMPRSFLSKEYYGNHNENHCEVVHEQGFTELQLSNASVSFYDSPGRISRSNSTMAYISPTSVEEKNQFVSSSESSTVCCKGNSVSMKQNPSSRDFQIHQQLELNSFGCSLDGESNSSSELCLPDEDSLITFDELFLMPDVENLAVVDSSMSSSPLKNPIEADVFSPSSPREMVEKLVEFILNDESSTHVDDPILHHGAGLGIFAHSMHAPLTPTKFCSNQLNPERDPQEHNKFQRNSIDSTIYSFFSHSFPFSKFSQPFPLYHDELKRFDHEVSQTMLQQIINPNNLHCCSISVSQSGVPQHLPALQRASCTQKLNSMQNCTFAYQEPKHYGDFIRPNPDFQGDSNINPALVDSFFENSFIEMTLRASHWHPHVPGF